MLDQETSAALDEWRRVNMPLETRHAAVRFLLRAGMAATQERPKEIDNA